MLVRMHYFNFIIMKSHTKATLSLDARRKRKDEDRCYVLRIRKAVLAGKEGLFWVVRNDVYGR